MKGDPVTRYPVGVLASGYLLIGKNPPLISHGPVQVINEILQTVTIKGTAFPVENVWIPIVPTSISRGPNDTIQRLPYGTPLWGILLWTPLNGGGYAGEVTLGSYGGHRWTSLGKLVVCVWRDASKKYAVPNCGVSSLLHRRIHVEYIANR